MKSGIMWVRILALLKLIYYIIAELGDRPMARHTALDRGIGVRIPVSQQKTRNSLTARGCGFCVIQDCRNFANYYDI